MQKIHASLRALNLLTHSHCRRKWRKYELQQQEDLSSIESDEEMSLRLQEVESSDNDANNYRERFDNVTLFLGII